MESETLEICGNYLKGSHASLLHMVEGSRFKGVAFAAQGWRIERGRLARFPFQLAVARVQLFCQAKSLGLRD